MILSFFNPKKALDVGLLEILFALYPILTVYRYSFFPFSLFVLVVMDLIILSRKTKSKGVYDKYIKVLFVFVLLHELIVFFLVPTGGIFINKYIEYIIIFSSILYIYPNLNFAKLQNSLNIVAVISMVGLVYHFIMIRTGHVVYPLTIPFLPEMAADSKIYVSILRPTSFFYEPQHYCSFMLAPLFFAIIKEQKIWAALIILSLFLSTSSYGIIIAFIVLSVDAIFKKTSIIRKLEIVIGCLVLAFFLTNSSLFSSGIEKIENTDINRTSRLYNGPELISHMPKEDLVFGVPYLTVADYYFAGKVPGAYLIEKNDNIYLPSIYLIFAKFGIIGLLLYLASYFYYMFRRKELWILGGAILAGLFSNPDSLGSMYAFYIILIYTFLQYYKSNSNENSYINNSVY